MAKNNLNNVLKSLRKFGDEADKLIQDTTAVAASEIEADAKRLAPVDLGTLVKTIFSNEVDKYNWEVVSPQRYSAYMEFGTGGLVNVPDELKEIAQQYIGKGIRQVNIAPRPFMYPALINGRISYLDDLTDNLNDLTKKYN